MTQLTLSENLQGLADAVADECQSLRDKIGTLGSLTTVDKTSLVNAVNELVVAISEVTSVDDTTTNLVTTWSSSKITDAISAAMAQIMGTGTTTGLDTLAGIAASLTALQTAVGNTSTDFVAVFQNGLL